MFQIALRKWWQSLWTQGEEGDEVSDTLNLGCKTVQ
jgi:hypothetical protein